MSRNRASLLNRTSTVIGAEMPPGQNGDAATKAQFSDPVNFRDKKPAAVSVDADPSELPQMPASGVYNSR